jgi:hypothetical protein
MGRPMRRPLAVATAAGVRGGRDRAGVRGTLDRVGALHLAEEGEQDDGELESHDWRSETDVADQSLKRGSPVPAHRFTCFGVGQMLVMDGECRAGCRW